MSRVVIIGGGVAGLSLAYHLAHQGTHDVLLLERHRLTSGTSWNAAGAVSALHPVPCLTSFAQTSLQSFPRLERETGFSTGYRQTGGYWLSCSAEGQAELRRLANLGSAAGLTVREVSPELLSEELPVLSSSNLTGGLYVEEDGSVNPVDLCMAYARAARTNGAQIKEDCAVQGLNLSSDRIAGVTLQDGTMIPADVVVLATGVWSGVLAATIDITLPLLPMLHSHLVTESDPQFSNLPLMRVPERGLYFKGEVGRLLLGGYGAESVPWEPSGPEANRPFLELPEDWSRLAPLTEAALDLVPGLADIGTRRVMTGPEAFTPDTLPLLGESPEVLGLYVSAGYGGRGVVCSAGAGQALARWIADGARPDDLWPCDLARFAPRKEAVSEAAGRAAVTAHYAPAHALPQAPGLPLPLAPLWQEHGARFAARHGWQEPVEFAQAPKSEAGIMARGAALLDLTSQTKLQISGPDAGKLLSDLACSPLSEIPAQVNRTYLLNRKGGIEADAAVTTLGQDRFRITATAGVRWSLLRWLRHVSVGYDAACSDVTESEVTLGIMGAGAPELLTELVDGGWQDFPMATYRDVLFSGGAFRATRLGLLGEQGWEVSAKPDLARVIAQALLEAGARPMGYTVLDGCRIEKGQGRWGLDFGADHTPLACPFGPDIDWSRPFLGHGALEAQRLSGPTRRLLLFELEGGVLARPHDPIIEGASAVGALTSVTRGPRTGRHLALGWVGVPPQESQTETERRSFTVQVAAGAVSARVLSEPAFDPKGRRMAA